MARKRAVETHFGGGRKYFENSLGKEFDFTDSTGPYEYLLGALSGCFTYTLLGKYNDSYESIDLYTEGIKRDESPTTLKETVINMIVKGVESKEDFILAVNYAKEHCSIYQTIAKVSSMIVNVEFVE